MSNNVNLASSQSESDPESQSAEFEATETHGEAGCEAAQGADDLADADTSGAGEALNGSAHDSELDDDFGSAIEPLGNAEPEAGQEPSEQLTREPEDEDEEGAEQGSGSEELGLGELRSDPELQRELAALLFSSPEAMGPARIRMLLQRPSAARVKLVLAQLEAELEASPLPIVLRKIAGGWRLLTDPQLGDVVARMRKEPRPEKITGAAMETLAIVAYRQPVTKAEVEAIRGVQAGPMLRTLVDRGLARVTGRADLPGSPLQYGTSKEFLERFGLDSLKDLPRDGELTEE